MFFSVCHIVLVFFVVSDLVSSISQETGWEERLRNDLFCVGWVVKPYLILHEYITVSQKSHMPTRRIRNSLSTPAPVLQT